MDLTTKDKSFIDLKNLLIENGATFLIEKNFNFKTREKSQKCRCCGHHLEDGLCGRCLTLSVIF